ncbi:ABC transporter permease [Candidatus Pacearchaeota archaeon]|nr:ABC transporter permease [Candidatus Pacearchaeota archaeon]
MFFDYFLLALKNLRKRGIRSYLTMLGIFIGIAAVVSLISLGNGLESAITGQFSSLDPDKLVVQSAETGFGPPGATAVKKLTEHDLDLVKSVNGVEFAIPRYIRTAEVNFNKKSIFQTITSLPEDSEEADIVYDVLNAEILDGKLLSSSDRKKVILGNAFTDEETFGKELEVGNKLLIQKETFEVIGILEKSGSFIIDSVIIMPEQDLREILKIEDEIDLIAVQVQDSEKIKETAEAIENKLRKDRKQDLGEEDFAVQTPLESLSAITTILNIVNIVISGIAAISLLIGGIGIANTMYTSVLERTREIGAMKALGARRKDILALFITESALLGLAGGIIGAIIGLLLAFSASSLASNYLSGLSLQVQISYPLILSAISFSLIIGLISGILPAIQASRLSPVEALRR